MPGLNNDLTAWYAEFQMASRATLRSVGTGTLGSGMEDRQVFANLGTYKGKVVAIKTLDKTSINVKDRATLVEFKHVRANYLWNMIVLWKGNVVILIKFSSLTALEGVKMTTWNSIIDENIVKMTTLQFQAVCKTCACNFCNTFAGKNQCVESTKLWDSWFIWGGGY